MKKIQLALSILILIYILLLVLVKTGFISSKVLKIAGFFLVIIALTVAFVLFSIILKFIITKILKVIKQFLNERKYKKNIKIMDKSEEFERIYKKLYDENNDELEQKRKEYRKMHIIQFIFLGLLILSIVIIPFLKDITVEVLYLLMFSVVFFCVLWFISLASIYKYIENYKTYFKENIISSFIKSISEKFIYKYYYEDYTIEEINNVRNQYEEANFNNEKSFGIYYDDYIEGYLHDNIYIKMIDVKEYENKFAGIFAYTVTNNRINDRINIVKNSTVITDYSKIKLDSQEFEQYFNVYSENKILAMQLLTSDVMELILDFYKKFNLQFEIVFKDDKIYLRFISGELFEPKIYKRSMERRNLFIYYSILNFVADLTKNINKTLNELDI